RTVDRGVPLQARINNSSTGSFQNSDTITQSFLYGAVSSAWKASRGQKNKSQASVVAKGQLSDDAGHSGSWNLRNEQSSANNDTLTVNYTDSDGGGDWTETGRSFDIDRSGSSSSAFHQEDDGVGQPRAGEDERISSKHTIEAS